MSTAARMSFVRPSAPVSRPSSISPRSWPMAVRQTIPSRSTSMRSASINRTFRMCPASFSWRNSSINSKRMSRTSQSAERANVLIGRNMPHLLGKLLHVGWIPDIGGTPLPLVWDEDVADLVMAALRNRARGAFNASAEDLLNADELARRVGFRSVRTPSLLVLAYRTLRAALASFGLHLLPDPAWVDKMRSAMLVASSKRARTELGWCPHYPTATAVVKRFQEVSPRGTDLRVQLFLWFSILLLDRR